MLGPTKAIVALEPIKGLYMLSCRHEGLVTYTKNLVSMTLAVRR